MDRYDPDVTPDPRAWLALDESERKELAVAAHENLPAWHPKTQAKRTHAIMHVIVENQLATDNPPETRKALGRLLSAGLARHEAIHALAHVVAIHTWEMFNSRDGFDFEGMKKDLSALTAESWFRSG